MKIRDANFDQRWISKVQMFSSNLCQREASSINIIKEWKSEDLKFDFKPETLFILCRGDMDTEASRSTIGKEKKNPSYFVKLSKDLITLIALFLEPLEVQRLCISCQAVGGDEGLSEYWKDKVRQKAPSSGSIKAELVLTPTSSTLAAKKFVLNLLSQTKKQTACKSSSISYTKC